MNFKNKPTWRTLAICSVLLAANFSNPAHSKSNILGKTLEFSRTYKCKGAGKYTKKFRSIIRILGNGTILYEFIKGEGTGLQYKLNKTIKTTLPEKLTFTINGKRVSKRYIFPFVTTASQKGDWLKLVGSMDHIYLSPEGRKIQARGKGITSVKISKNKCSSVSISFVGWRRFVGGKKYRTTCKSSNTSCRIK